MFWLITGIMFMGSGLIWRRLLSFLGRQLEAPVPPMVCSAGPSGHSHGCRPQPVWVRQTARPGAVTQCLEASSVPHRQSRQHHLPRGVGEPSKIMHANHLGAPQVAENCLLWGKRGEHYSPGDGSDLAAGFSTKRTCRSSAVAGEKVYRPFLPSRVGGPTGPWAGPLSRDGMAFPCKQDTDMPLACFAQMASLPRKTLRADGRLDTKPSLRPDGLGSSRSVLTPR